VFELVGPIATKALAAGRTAEAENILNAHLNKVLDDLKKGRPVSPAALDAALGYSLELAGVLRSAKWLNFAFDLLVLGRVLLDARLAQRLQSAMTRVDTIDAPRVAGYVEMLRQLPQSFEKVRALHQAEELVQAASRKR
jgi:hypothetical protein